MKKLIILPLITMLSMSLLSMEQFAEAKKDKGEKPHSTTKNKNNF